MRTGRCGGRLTSYPARPLPQGDAAVRRWTRNAACVPEPARALVIQSPQPMARRRLEGLERVLGVNALFSTAYGNVGSSIYYALGLVASYALGLTPVVF